MAREIIIMTFEFLLPDQNFDVPGVSWFSNLRESLGIHIQRVQKKLAKENAGNEITMVLSIDQMVAKFNAIQSCAGAKEKWLLGQVKARLEGKKFTYETVDFPAKFLKQQGKIRMSPAGKLSAIERVAFFKELLTLMITYDLQNGHYTSPPADVESELSLYRKLPQPGPELSCRFMRDLEQRGKDEAQKLRIEDDEEFLPFDKYVDKVFYDADFPNTCYKVIRIEYCQQKGFLAQTLECDLEGVIGQENYLDGEMIDTYMQPYTLQNNLPGFSMDEMIAAFKEYREESQHQLVDLLAK